MKSLRLAVIFASTFAGLIRPIQAAESVQPSNLVLWYCLHYQAPGENRYPADGAYKDILEHLRHSFEVRVNAERPTTTSLRGVNILLIANPNAAAVGTNSPPPHMDEQDRQTLTRYVRRGGGLMVMGNQDNHNLEIDHVNRLLSEFGLAFRNDYTDFKRVTFPLTDPVVGGLRWAYYSGNRVELLPSAQKGIRCRGWYLNDPKDRPDRGDRSAAGYLLASSEAGKGRVLVVTDCGWIVNNAMNGVGINGLYMPDHQNAEIMTRLVRWAGSGRTSH